MIDRPLTVSFGTAQSLAVLSSVRTMTWAQFATWLTATPPEKDDKAARGWYVPAEFQPAYRDSDNFVARHALTLDLDHVGTDTWQRVLDTWGGLAFAMYTTWSHMAEKPRFRVVMPLSRPATYDEFQAVVRKVASDIDIELFARESFTPAQCMFAPTRKPGAEFISHINDGDWLDVDAVLAEYADWTDHTTWPHRKDHDGVHKAEAQTRPDQKPGIVGDFCRTFRVPDAIKRFELPYVPTATEGRWTYTKGSRPEGAIEYDDGLKFHSHHDTDPARGQNNAFDLVRLHRFGELDDAAAKANAVTERPSYRAMCQLALEQPELRAASAASDFALIGGLGPLTEPEKIEQRPKRDRFVVQEPGVFSGGPPLRWIVKHVLPRAEVAVLYGAPGVGKSFLALDLSAAITRGIKWQNKTAEKGRVVYVAAEGAGGFRQRLQAYARSHNIDICELPAVIADAPNMLEAEDVKAVTQRIVDWAKGKEEGNK
ncbi:MAG: AAA family ATPase [Steroidobacteraceae bacterium]